MRDLDGCVVSSAWNWSWWWHPEVAWANETLPGQGCGAKGTGCPSPIGEAQGAGDVAMGGRRASQSWRGAERGTEPQNARCWVLPAPSSPCVPHRVCAGKQGEDSAVTLAAVPLAEQSPQEDRSPCPVPFCCSEGSGATSQGCRGGHGARL